MNAAALLYAPEAHAKRRDRWGGELHAPPGVGARPGGGEHRGQQSHVLRVLGPEAREEGV